MNALDIPLIGITVKHPWGAFIVLGNKRHENRVASVAGEARKYLCDVRMTKPRHVAITASLNYSKTECDAVIAQLQYDVPSFYDAECTKRMLVQRLTGGGAWKHGLLWDWFAMTAGKIIGVAELVDVVPNGDEPFVYWQVAGQHSLVLGRVWQVEPVPCTGGPGIFHFGKCSRCGRPMALTYANECKQCVPAVDYPTKLTVKAVYGPDGEAI